MNFDAAGEDGLAETYRAGVAAWECDAFGHLNIAFYGERFADAAATLMEHTWPALRWRTRSLDIRYRRELCASEVIAIRSGILGTEQAGIRLAHRGVNEAGDCTTLAEHLLAPVGPTPAPPGTSIAWEAFGPLELPAGEGPLTTFRNRVREREAEEGSLSLLGHLHRFSDACLSLIGSIGMDDDYRRRADRGFATVETRLLMVSESAAPGAGVVVTSGVIGVGASSLRMLHRLRDARDGTLLSQFYQAGVNFDLTARRAAPWPPEFRVKAESLRISGA